MAVAITAVPASTAAPATPYNTAGPPKTADAIAILFGATDDAAMLKPTHSKTPLRETFIPRGQGAVLPFAIYS